MAVSGPERDCEERALGWAFLCGTASVALAPDLIARILDGSYMLGMRSSWASSAPIGPIGPKGPIDEQTDTHTERSSTQIVFPDSRILWTRCFLAPSATYSGLLFPLFPSLYPLPSSFLSHF